jgi:hypothetical protein
MKNVNGKYDLTEMTENVYVSARGLTSLTQISFAERLEGNLFCERNKLVNLEGCPPYIGGSLSVINNPISSLTGVHRIVRHVSNIWLPYSIQSSILGLLKIEGLHRVIAGGEMSPGGDRFDLAIRLINKHLRGDRDILACQEELIDNGLEEFAQL